MIVIAIVVFIFVASYIFFISGLESIDKKRRTIYEKKHKHSGIESHAGQNEKTGGGEIMETKKFEKFSDKEIENMFTHPYRNP